MDSDRVKADQCEGLSFERRFPDDRDSALENLPLILLSNGIVICGGLLYRLASLCDLKANC